MASCDLSLNTHAHVLLVYVQVWGYLALVNARTGRRLECEQATRYAVTCKLADAALLSEIKAELVHAGFDSTFHDFEAFFAAY